MMFDIFLSCSFHLKLEYYKCYKMLAEKCACSVVMGPGPGLF